MIFWGLKDRFYENSCLYIVTDKGDCMELDHFKGISEQEWADAALHLLNYVKKRYAKVMLRGLDGEDFVYGAIDDLISGKRKYRSDLSLFENLKRTVTSNLCKSFRMLENKNVQPMGEDCDKVLEDLESCGIPTEWDKGFIPMLEKEIEDDDDLRLICISILDNGAVKSRDISKDTGIAVERVYELRRKLGDRIRKVQDMLAKREET